MRFELEKISSSMIERRVREEERRTQRQVTTVLLTEAEWCEFMNQPELRYMQLRDYYEIALRPRALTACVSPFDHDSMMDAIRVVRVRPSR